MSFWFGFCPLHEAGGLKKALKPVISLGDTTECLNDRMRKV